MIKRNLKIIGFIILGALLVYNVSPKDLDVLIYSALILILLVVFVKNIIEYVRTRNGVFSKGVITEAKTLKDGGDENNYALKVQFQSPIDQKVYQIDYKAFLFSKISHKKEVKVWVNKRDVSKSIVTDKFNNYWVLNLIQIFIFISVLSILLFKSLR